jgi:hypothetical protein
MEKSCSTMEKSCSTVEKPCNYAIFDFDGTVVSRNTGSVFYQWMAKHSLVRVIALTFCLPILVPLRIFAFFTNSPLAQSLGLNIVCLVSTSFLKIPLFRLRRRFIAYYFSCGGAKVHPQAIDRIRHHQQQGDTVVIISGCPHWILHGVARHIGIHNVILIGSKVDFSWKGLLLKQHCHQKNKVRMALDHGIDLSRCHYGYSDSPTDAAILQHCKQVVLVNSNVISSALLQLQLPTPLSRETWK